MAIERIEREVIVRAILDVQNNMSPKLRDAQAEAKRLEGDLARVGKTAMSGGAGRAAGPTLGAMGAPAQAVQSEGVRARREEAKIQAQARGDMQADLARERMAARLDEERRKIDPEYRARAEEMDLRREESRKQRERERTMRPLGRMMAAGGAIAGVGLGLGAMTGNQDFTKVGSLAGGITGGMAAGAALGSIIPGVGTAVGAGVGALVGGVFGPISDALKESREAAEKFKTSMGGMADSMMRSITTMAGLRDGMGVTLAAFGALSDPVRARILRVPEAERPAVIATELSRVEREGPAGPAAGSRLGGMFAGVAGGDIAEGIRTGITTRSLAHEAELSVLREASRTGIPGVTRPMDVPGGFTDVAGIGSGIMESLASRRPEVVAAERTAEAMERVATMLASLGITIPGALEAFRVGPDMA